MDASGVSAARPHIVRAAVAFAVVIAAMIVGLSFGQLQDREFGAVTTTATTWEKAFSIGAVVVVVVGGFLAIRSLNAAIRAAIVLDGQRHVAPLGLLISFIGYVAMAICVIALLERPVGGLLLGGALTGVMVGIAAQQVLANLFAGIVLLAVRPFTIADDIVLKSGPLGGEYEGLVTDMGLFYVKLHTRTGPVALPNSGVLASAVGPGVRAAEEPAEEDEAQAAARSEGAPPSQGGAP